MDLAELAARQHAVARVDQLRAAGVGPAAVRRRLRDGVWTRVLPGVVALHPGRLTDEARRQAVCLWLPRGVLCGPTAAAVHGIRTRPTRFVHVAVTSGRPYGGDWVRVRRLGRLPSAQVVRVGGLVVTSPARTVVDVHETTTGQVDRQAVVTDSVQRRITSAAAIVTAAVTTPALRRRSELAATVLRVLDGTESVAELAFADFCAAWGLPRPQQQYGIRTRLGTLHVDFAFVAERVAVEIDGVAGHAFDRQRRRDHERDLALAALGWVCVRVEPRRLVTSPQLVHADLARTLAQRSGRASA